MLKPHLQQAAAGSSSNRTNTRRLYYSQDVHAVLTRTRQNGGWMQSVLWEEQRGTSYFIYYNRYCYCFDEMMYEYYIPANLTVHNRQGCLSIFVVVSKQINHPVNTGITFEMDTICLVISAYQRMNVSTSSAFTSCTSMYTNNAVEFIF